MPGPKAPEVSPSSVINLRGEASDLESSGPLRVVFASPKGALRGPSEINILFSKPMRALESAEIEVAPKATLSPPVEGTWQWSGTRALRFVPSRAEGGGSIRLPHATRFTVTVPKGVAAVDGETLSEDYSFSFETPRPEVEISAVDERSDALTPNAKFEMRWSQPIDPAELERMLEIRAGGAVVGGKVEPAERGETQRFFVTPRAALPLATPIEVKVKKGLRGREGSLPTESDLSEGFSTYGPLTVKSIACSRALEGERCPSPGSISIDLTNPVRFKDLKAALTIEPAAAVRWPTWLSDDDHVSDVWLDAAFKPGATYQISIRAGIKDVHGQTLAKGETQSLSFSDLDPLARIGLTSGVMEASAPTDFTIGAINTKDLEYVLVPMTEERILERADREFGPSQLFKEGQTVRGLPAGPRNVVKRHKVPLGALLDGKGRGTFAVGIRYTDGGRNVVETSIVQRTDLAISARVSKFGSAVLVTTLGTGAPVAGATVQIRRNGAPTLVEAKTDQRGLAIIEASAWTPAFSDENSVIFASKDGDVAHHFVSDNHEDWAFSNTDDSTLGLLFNDRGIYRPGEIVHVKGIVREPTEKGTATPAAGAKVEFEMSGPGDNQELNVSATTTAFGTYSADIKIPANARVGTFYITANRAGQSIGSTSFEVADYRPVEFKAAVSSDRGNYVRGDVGKWTARGDYLFGAPMNGVSADVTVSRREAWFTPPGAEAYTVSDSSYLSDRPYTARPYVVTRNPSTLDAKGVSTATAKLDLPGQTGAEWVTANVDVTDISRQVVSASSTALVHPGEHYLGLMLEDRFVGAGTELKPKVAAFRPDGSRVVGARVTLSLIKRTWATTKQVVGESATSVTSPVETTVGSCALISGKDDVGCTLRPADAGEYFLRATGDDGRKNQLASSIGLYVSGESSSATPLFRQDDDSEIELIPNKSSYRVGDVAKILVKSPWKGATALVSVERAGIFEKRVVSLQGAAPVIDVPITDAMHPNAYVSVMVLRGRTKPSPNKLSSPDVGAPAVRMGLTNLILDPEAKRLNVGVVPNKREARPGEEVSVALHVEDAAKKKESTELTVFAVDEGVLSLVNYAPPDPIKVFGAPRSLHVAGIDTRYDLAGRFDPLSGLGLDKGLDGGGGEDRGGGATSVRKDFRASAFWNGAVVTDAQGDASVSFKLPDGLTTYRVMAVATGRDDKFGLGSSSITTQRPLMVRPALPRFLRAGDAFYTSAIVTSTSKTKEEVTVVADLEGAVLEGEKTQTVSVEPGASVEVRFATQAPRAGAASFSFTASSRTESDAVRQDRTIAAPAWFESVAAYGSTSSEAAEKLGDLGAVRDDVGELQITTSSTALVGLGSGASQLLDYPYGCTEQLVSRLVPIVAMNDLSKEFNLPVPPNVEDVTQKTIAKILSHQRIDGTFGFWPTSDSANPWVTAYALWGLSEAKKKGFAVPESALESGAKALVRTLQSGNAQLSRQVGPFYAYVLAELGKPDPALTSRLYAQREDMPAYSKALLLSAMVATQLSEEWTSELATELESTIRMDGPNAKVLIPEGSIDAVTLDSDTRTTALTLRALLQYRPSHPMAAPLAMGLLSNRQGGQWRTTQEAAWSLLALSDYRRAQEGAVPNFTANIFFGSDLASEQRFEGRSTQAVPSVFPMAQVKSQAGAMLGFSVEGEGRLFYQARLRYAKRDLPTTSLDRGFYVEKKYRKVTPATLTEALATVPSGDLSTFTGGDLVLADLIVVTPSHRDFVVIDDPLPAGFEAVDLRLATTSGNFEGLDRESDDEDSEEAGQSSSFIREVRDDRVLFFVDSMSPGIFRYRYLARATSMGKFITPPVKVEEMYSPEVFGRTGSLDVTVTP